MTDQGGVSREHGSSLPQKLIFWLLHFMLILICAWLALFDGLAEIGSLFGFVWHLSDPSRALVLLTFAVIYFLRHGITLFYLFVRKVEWSEALGLISFFALFEIGLLIVGGGAFRDEALPFGPLDVVAGLLFLFGSWLNSWSEIQRKWWKQDPAHKGHCYTGGLFSYSMHINYFGDVVLFTGWSLMTHNLWTLALPIFMFLSFAFMHMPALDAYLAKRYGAEFEAYAARTKKLVPFIW
ncbi:isoprenylcysteine carboxylmethyltransferase family protein [Rhizobium sp. L1K21]|uniref:methyltransferase family protein n=1 Tax=Rhizobium sp. L1K21 TaxID=2954933 RepID=UPI002093D9C8|nr:DUF1295 domain-containing protein [Rhizobium sp. L1K21]MCO6186800.1 DUF1295 domain-containing protein [Rhizobium sp. L1K21]